MPEKKRINDIFIIGLVQVLALWVIYVIIILAKLAIHYKEAYEIKNAECIEQSQYNSNTARYVKQLESENKYMKNILYPENKKLKNKTNEKRN